MIMSNCSIAEAETSVVKCFCLVLSRVFHVYGGKENGEKEGWSSLQQVEILFSQPLLFVSTAGRSQG